MAVIDGRYAAESDSEVTGEGGGGRRRREGKEAGMSSTDGILV